MPSFGGLRGKDMVHMWLVGKRVADLVLVVIKLFHLLSRLICYEQILAKIVLFKGGAGLL